MTKDKALKGPALCPTCKTPLDLIAASLTFNADAMVCRPCHKVINRIWGSNNTYRLIEAPRDETSNNQAD